MTKRENAPCAFLPSVMFTAIMLICGGPTTACDVSNPLKGENDTTSSPSRHAIGLSDRSQQLDLAEEFRNPPTGYGEVPFFWWNGDTLECARLLWQLDVLHKAGVQGFAVSYHHSHVQADSELNKNGYGAWGRTVAGDPPALSDAWWSIWNWFSAECGKRGMGVGLDDYTFNWRGNGYWPDEIAKLPKMKNYLGRLVISDPVSLDRGATYEHRIADPKRLLAVIAYPVTMQGLDAQGALDLLPMAQEGIIRWKASTGESWQVIRLELDLGNELHPDLGKEVIDHYFSRFEGHLDADGKKGMNYFFQDELDFSLKTGKESTWAEDFPDQFRTRKGYDVVPYLAALAIDIGPVTPKVRLDYSDVMMHLAEERYFRPIFEWHQSRGLLYGCDNIGRGLEPLSYGDYFRATRWFSAPGNDVPGRGLSFIQTKVSSSIAHLYDRPRVWLEAFHSMGWDTHPEWLTEQLDRHLLFGGNLLCLHGLYYTLHGGWWEWAPPCFHFHMPYWAHMKTWLKYGERLSYLLSQGHHVCDVAVVYPVSPLRAGYVENPEVAFNTARQLYDAGIDFDFIDEQSVARAEAAEGALRVGAERYTVLVLADMAAVRYATLEKAVEHFRNGGIVVAVGSLPDASDRAGREDPKVDRTLKELFGQTAVEARAGQATELQSNTAGGKGLYLGSDVAAVPKRFVNWLVPDLKPVVSQAHYLHRRVDDHEIYMVMDVREGEECFFRAKGKAELWDAWTGAITPLPTLRQDEHGSWVRIPRSPPRSSLIVFRTEVPATQSTGETQKRVAPEKTVTLDGAWECELVPTLDNRWGDYRLPASNTIIGAEAREFRYSTETEAGEGWQTPSYDDSAWRTVRNSFGPHLWMLNAPAELNFEETADALLNQQGVGGITAGEKSLSWKPYEFSWRWGVKDQPGSQGYHGLKGKLSDGFLIMGEGGHYFFRTTVHVNEPTTVRVLTMGRPPDRWWLDRDVIRQEELDLSAGDHELVLGYRAISAVPYQPSSHLIDERVRSAVVLVRKDSPPGKRFPLAMRWYGDQGRLVYDLYSGQWRVGCYRFTAPPGLKEMTFVTHGDVEAWVNGKKAKAQMEETLDDGSTRFRIALAKTVAKMSTVALRILHHSGYYDGAAFVEPIALHCGTGKIETGDWSGMGVLRDYSGGMWYRRSIDLKREQINGPVILDLGRVVATCEVHVNDQTAGLLVNSPFRLDITNFVKNGKNRLEVLVYNTLSNHYQTTPTPYKGEPVSGLLGPVRVLVH